MRDRQVLRLIAKTWLNGQKGQATVVVSSICGNAVVASVGTVQKAAVRSDLYVGTVARTIEILRQRCDRLPFDQESGFRNVVEYRNRIAGFVDDVDVLSIWMEYQMAGPGTGWCSDKRLPIG